MQLVAAYGVYVAFERVTAYCTEHELLIVVHSPAELSPCAICVLCIPLFEVLIN